ncbi:hypothetical protein KAM380_096700 [Aeromonas caviae]|jgi:uncharacterized protein (DUF849 family)|nr:hypothetical protein BGP81_13850 [Pseudomonas putida]GJB85205.1 hypothetical protein KAM380_096700 [Aeromonas caviae]
MHDSQALAKIGFEQTLTLRSGKLIGAVQHDIVDRKTAAIDGLGRPDRLGAFARQFLQLLQTPLRSR